MHVTGENVVHLSCWVTANPLSLKLPVAHLFQTNVLLCPKQQPPMSWKCGLSFLCACKPQSFGLYSSWVYGVGWPWLWEIVWSHWRITLYSLFQHKLGHRQYLCLSFACLSLTWTSLSRRVFIGLKDVYRYAVGLQVLFNLFWGTINIRDLCGISCCWRLHTVTRLYVFGFLGP